MIFERFVRNAKIINEYSRNNDESQWWEEKSEFQKMKYRLNLGQAREETCDFY